MENKYIQNEIESLKQEIKKQNKALVYVISGLICFASSFVFLEFAIENSFFELLFAGAAFLTGLYKMNKGLKELK